MPVPYTMKFIIMVWLAFFARHRPVSTIANPACMNMTRKPQIRVHTKLMAILFCPTWLTKSGEGQALFGVGDADIHDGAGKRAVRVALGPHFGLGRFNRFEVLIRDRDGRRRGCGAAEAPRLESGHCKVRRTARRR